LLRKHGAEVVDGNQILVSGTGAWKTLMVSSAKTGEVIVEKKFYKQDFGEVMYSPEYGPYVDSLLKACMVKEYSPQNMEVDAESYEEIRSIAMEIEEDLLVPGE
jgi:hypothetical protein